MVSECSQSTILPANFLKDLRMKARKPPADVESPMPIQMENLFGPKARDEALVSPFGSPGGTGDINIRDSYRADSNASDFPLLQTSGLRVVLEDSVE